jgi:type II secretory pathway pseudopilin PulG
MVVLLAIMAIFLTVAVETATFQKRRENEEELIFRGNQFVEAIRLFRARNGRFPITLDELAKAKPKVIRKKWTDPVTGKFDWVPIFLGQGGTGVALPGQRPVPTPTPQPFGTPTGTGQFPTAEARGPIIGVHSRSCDESIKVVDGRSRYCDWQFVFDAQKLKPQLPIPATPAPQP